MSEEKKDKMFFKVGDDDYINVDDCFMLVTDKWDAGHCVCCGGTTSMWMASNVLLIFCEDDPAHNLECKRQEECIGIDHCVNKEHFSDEYVSIVVEKSKEIISTLIDKFDIVVIASTPETRKIIADEYFCNPFLTVSQVRYKMTKLIKIEVSRMKYDAWKKRIDDAGEVKNLINSVESVSGDENADTTGSGEE